MSFERKSHEQILDNMVRWVRGTTPRLTDFRVGSKVRTIFEAVSVAIEELYDRVYRFTKQLVEENIYSIVAFDKLPAVFASGIVTLTRTTPADTNYIIPAGTVVLSRATEFSAPNRYRTVTDAVLLSGQSTIDVAVVAVEAGARSNVEAGGIVDFLTKPIGIDGVTNTLAFTNGKNEESTSEQKVRFQAFIQSNNRGVLQAIQYGATLAQLKDVNGNVTERVAQAIAVEDLVTKLGQVDVYIWNGVGTASEPLKALVQTILTGFYAADGAPVYGYKAGGIQTNVMTAETVPLKLKAVVVPKSWTTVAALEDAIDAEVLNYFANLKLGAPFVQSALQSNIKFIDGVADIRLSVSTDGGTTYTTDNVTTEPQQIAILGAAVIYEVGTL